MDVELKDHIGEAVTGEPVDHDQYIVFVDGVQIGYLPKGEGAWLQCIVHMDESTKTEVMECVARKAGVTIGGAAVPCDPDLIEDDDE